MSRTISGWQLSSSILELFGLMMWIGGLTVILTGIIPAVFNTLGMETGGRFLRRIFDNYNILVSGVVILLLLTTTIRGWNLGIGPTASQGVSRLEIGVLASIAIVTVFIVVILGPKAVALQELAFTAEGEVETKLAYEAFFRTHMIVRALHLINVGLAVSLLVIKFKRWLNFPCSFGYES
jgi:uncharacterized membrane protein